MTSSQIFNLFIQVSKQTGFEVIETDSQNALAVHKGGPFSYARAFMNCIPISFGQSHELAEQDSESAQ